MTVGQRKDFKNFSVLKIKKHFCVLCSKSFTSLVIMQEKLFLT